MSTPYVVLARYVPKVWNSREIGHYLTELTHSHSLHPHADAVHGAIPWKRGWYSKKLHAEVRLRTIDAPAACDWHKDGDLKQGSNMNCALVTWANRTPTQFLFNGQIFQPEPFEVVIARNLGCSHRRPPDAPRRRWMFRQRVQVPVHLSLP